LTLSYNITYFFSIFQMAKRAQIKLIHSKRHFQVIDLEVMQISGPQDEGADLRVEQMTWPQGVGRVQPERTGTGSYRSTDALW